MHIPKREKVEAAFAASSSQPLLAEMERRYEAWEQLRDLVESWRKLSSGVENGMAVELCATELEEVLDRGGDR